MSKKCAKMATFEFLRLELLGNGIAVAKPELYNGGGRSRGGVLGWGCAPSTEKKTEFSPENDGYFGAL